MSEKDKPRSLGHGMEALAALQKGAAKKRPAQPEQTPLEKKQHRRREIVTAAAWQQIVAKHVGMDPKKRAQLAKEITYEVTVEDLRDFAVSIVHETFGRDEEAAFAEVKARGAAAPSTLRNWKNGTVLRPQLSKVRQVALTCGWDLRFVKLEGNR